MCEGKRAEGGFIIQHNFPSVVIDDETLWSSIRRIHDPGLSTSLEKNSGMLKRLSRRWERWRACE